MNDPRCSDSGAERPVNADGLRADGLRADGLRADDDLLLRQVRAVLTPMPAVDRRHIAQILAAANARRRTPLQRLSARLEELLEWWRFSTPPLARGATLAVAALTIGFVARGYIARPGGEAVTAPRVAVDERTAGEGSMPMAAPAPTQMVEGATAADARRVPVQFVLDARDVPTAGMVSIVGDFNAWDANATPLQLENGVWTGTVPLRPGRHVYAFVVNGEIWLADPRAPQAADADFGRPGSVIIVQAP